MAHPDEEVVRKMFEAAAAGDLAAIQEQFSPDIAWHEPGKSPVSGDLNGLNEFLGLFAKTFELSGGTFKLDVRVILSSADHVVALTTASAERAGRTWSDHQVNVFHVENGKITESWNHPGDLYAKDEFWS